VTVTAAMLPDRTEAAEYYFTYISQVPGGDVVQLLEQQLAEVRDLLAGIPEARSLHRYAEGKWSIREVMSHINDAERVFTFRALWFGRGLEGSLPSFEQDVTVASAHADAMSLGEHRTEFEAIRASTLALFRGMPADAWLRRGVASGNEFTVRALAFITVGHAAHHLRLLRERYL
jgi:hypothetical protein